MSGSALAVAQIELRLGARNRWLLLSATVLTVFALVLGIVGAAPTGTVKVDPLTVTVVNLATLSVYLVPLMALLLAFDAIAGEVERGTIQLVLASPISRSSLVAGKFLGHFIVLGAAVTIGYGIAGAAVYLFAGGTAEGLISLVRLIASSIGLGAAFLAIGYVASALTRQSGTAAAVAVGIWLIAVVLYDLALFGALIADADGPFSRFVFPWLLLINPADAFRLFNMALVDAGGSATSLSGIANALPFPVWMGALSLAFWTVLAIALSALFVRRIEP